MWVLLPAITRAQATLPVARTSEEPTILRSGPSADYDRVAELPKGLKLAVESTRGGWTKVRLSRSVAGWIEASQLEALENGAQPSQPVIKLIQIKKEPGEVRMEIRLSEPGVVLIEEWLRPPVLWLRFHNALAALFEIDYDPKDTLIDHVAVRQETEDVVAVRIDLKRLTGFRMIQKDPEHLVVKFQLSPSSKALWGWRICVDPGHGGKDTGAIGPTGLYEKTANLAMARRLGQLLEKNGARVIFTRTTDTGLAPPEAPVVEELRARVNAGRKKRANLFVSIHCNARPTTAEGRLARGSYVYFFQPHSAALARAVSASLEGQIWEPKFGVIFRSFHVIRETDFPAVLVETVFISNPVTEALLRKESFQIKVARGIVHGIVRYVRSLSR